MSDAVTEKTVSTLRARAALAGVVVHETVNDCGQPEYIATKWHLTRVFASLSDLEAWLDRIGAPGGRTVG